MWSHLLLILCNFTIFSWGCFWLGLLLVSLIEKNRQGKTLQVQKLANFFSQVQDKNLKVQKFVKKSNL